MTGDVDRRLRSPYTGVVKASSDTYIDTFLGDVTYLRVGKPSGKADCRYGYWTFLAPGALAGNGRFPTLRAVRAHCRASRRKAGFDIEPVNVEGVSVVETGGAPCS